MKPINKLSQIKRMFVSNLVKIIEYQKYYFVNININLILIKVLMGKQPTTGQKKSKESIAKAATQKKAGHKKWTKGKVKEKVNHAVFIDQQTYNRILTGIPKLGKCVSVSSVVDKFKVSGSLARMLIRDCIKNGSLKQAQKHSKQVICSPTAVAVEKKEVTGQEEKGKKGKKK